MKVVDLCVWAELDFSTDADDQNHTIIRVNGDQTWPRKRLQEIAPVVVAVGDQIEIDIPSGVLSGIVSYVREDSPQKLRIHIQPATWTGKAAGLEGGLCGCGTFHVESESVGVVVESSTLTAPVAYPIYRQVRYLAEMVLTSEPHDADDEVWFEALPSTKARLMAALFAACKTA